MTHGKFMRVIALVALAGAASFRRGGMAFTAEPTPIEPGQLEPKALLAILTEPRLRVEISEDGESWMTVPESDVAQLAELLADEPNGPDAADPPRSEVDGAPAGGKPAKARG